MNIPYTYYLEWTTGMKYYGVRYAQNCNPVDLWNPYKTSSEYVAAYIKEHGDPAKKEIRKTFLKEDRVSAAIRWEHTVLRRMNAAIREDYLNKRDSKGINYQDPAVAEKRNTNMKLAITSPAVKEKRKETDALPETRERRKLAAILREADPLKKANRIMKAFSDEAKEKRRLSFARTVGTPEFKEKRSKLSSEINARPEILKNNQEKNSGLNNPKAIQKVFLFKNKLTDEEKQLTCFEMTQYLRTCGIKYGQASTLVKLPNSSLAGWMIVTQ